MKRAVALALVNLAALHAVHGASPAGNSRVFFPGEVLHCARLGTITLRTDAGAAGLAGEFAGWMSDDEASVPIRAELVVLLGTAAVELQSWYRPGWSPPTGVRAAHE